MKKLSEDQPGHCAACGDSVTEHGEGSGKCFARPLDLFGFGETACWCPKYVTDFAEAVSVITKHGDSTALQRGILRAIDRRDRANANRLFDEHLTRLQRDHPEVTPEHMRHFKELIDALPENVAVGASDATSSPERAEQQLLYSDDYRAVTFRGKKYALTTNQAIVVQALHEAHRQGLAGLSSSVLLEKLESPSGRLRDSFRSGDGPAIWTTLIVKVRGRRDMYSLDLL